MASIELVFSLTGEAESLCYIQDFLNMDPLKRQMLCIILRSIGTILLQLWFQLLLVMDVLYDLGRVPSSVPQFSRLCVIAVF